MTDNNWYSTREIVKAAAGITGSRFDASVDLAVESASRQIEHSTHTWFIPRIETRKYDARWPVIIGQRLTFDAYVISISAFTDEGDNVAPVASTDYRLLPENDGPPYYAVEILTDVGGADFKADPNTPQQSFRVTGSWGAYSATVAATELSAAITDAADTTFDVKDSGKVDVGDTVLIGTEQAFVSERTMIDLAVNTSGALDADLTDTGLGLGDPADDLIAGEVVRIDSEQMLVESVNSATSVVFQRAVNGTILAAHSSGADIYVARRLTAIRGVNGTTAATHADDAPITKYAPPIDVRQLATAMAVDEFKQGQAGWGREVGRGDLTREFTGNSIAKLRKRVVRAHRRDVMASV